MKKAIVDTNVLLDYPNVIQEFDEIYLPSAVLEELDKLKRDRNLGFKARRVSRVIDQATNIKYPLKDIYVMPDGWDEKKMDNKIVMCAKEMRQLLTDNDSLVLVSNDLLVRAKAEALGIEYTGYSSDHYKGIYDLKGTTNEINEFFADGIGELLENEYLIVHNVDTDEVTEMVVRNGQLKELLLPPSKAVKGWNSKQRCALDLLYNPDIPIKIIAGIAGSGKTKLAVAMGIYGVMEDDAFEKMVLVRNPIGSGEDVGYLKGGLDEKTDIFFAPVLESCDSTELVRSMVEKGFLEKKIPFHMKGLTIPESYILIDEAEDLDLKTLKLIGSRIGKDSNIVFCGDYKQAEGKFIQDNGLLQLIEGTKGNPLVGIVVLDDDVRSSASKVFANLE
jgi:PhoH-like ATPase